MEKAFPTYRITQERSQERIPKGKNHEGRKREG